MLHLFKSKIFLRQFLFLFSIICLIFVIISFTLFSVTKTSLEKQQLYMVESYRLQTSQAIKAWLLDKEHNIKNQSLYLGQLSEDKLGSTEIHNKIKEQLSLDENYLDIIILDGKGTIINSSDTSNMLNLSYRDFFINGMNGSSTVTGFYKGEKTGIPIMAVSAPLYYDGKPRYVLAAIISLERVKEIIENQNFGNFGHVYLVDTDGMFITHSSFIKEYVDEIKDKEKYRINSLAAREVQQKYSGTLSYSDFMGEMVFGSYEWLDSIKAGLIVEFKAKTVMAPVSNLIDVIGLLAIFIVVIGTIAALLYSRNIINPINILISSTQDIIKQNYENPINTKTNTELDILIDNFNKMQSAIQIREGLLLKKNNDLRIQTQEAMDASKLKSEFLANISHELRTPLNSIIGFTSRVIKKSSDTMAMPQLENLIIVKNEGEHLLKIINDLLDYSKAEAGKMEIHAEYFNLVEVISEVSTMISSFLEDKPIEYTQKLLPISEMTIYSDRTKLRQILINLLSNAFKYSEKGAVTLSVDMENSFYRIIVKDEGIGIAPENLENIFEAFHQVDGSYTRKVGGTGLGLTITRRFIEMLGGNIDVQSVLGSGSCFTVHIPVKFKDIDRKILLNDMPPVKALSENTLADGTSFGLKDAGRNE